MSDIWLGSSLKSAIMPSSDYNQGFSDGFKAALRETRKQCVCGAVEYHLGLVTIGEDDDE